MGLRWGFWGQIKKSCALWTTIALCTLFLAEDLAQAVLAEKQLVWILAVWKAWRGDHMKSLSRSAQRTQNAQDWQALANHGTTPGKEMFDFCWVSGCCRCGQVWSSACLIRRADPGSSGRARFGFHLSSSEVAQGWWGKGGKSEPLDQTLIQYPVMNKMLELRDLLTRLQGKAPGKKKA